jgi:hypothetical protein
LHGSELEVIPKLVINIFDINGGLTLVRKIVVMLVSTSLAHVNTKPYKSMRSLLFLAINTVPIEGVLKLSLEELSDLLWLGDILSREELNAGRVIACLVSSIQILIIFFLQFFIKVDNMRIFV